MQFIWFIISGMAWWVVNYLIDRKLWVVGAYPVYILTGAAVSGRAAGW